ncbi:hypothetical protein [Alistipes sp.]|uniref:hypothetical protein n=1 Tax=Alistipes sp. TaxID=1872444 RepID=UPI0011C7BBB1
MKKLLRYMLCALAGAAALGLTACNDSDDTPPREDPVVVPPPEAIGTYSFDGTKGDIVDGVYTEDDYDLQFIFSPQMMTSTIETYFIIGVHRYWVGQTVDAEQVYHNDDYLFVYEDPWYLYTQYKKVTGSIYIDRKGDRFTVELDLHLHDGKPFTASFTGELRNGLDTEE